MNLSNIKWELQYNLFTDYLYSLQDKKYREFHKKILKSDDLELIGIRTPNLKKIAKDISKSDYESFFKNNKHKTYEEVIIHGLVIGYLKRPFKEILDYLDIFLPYNVNWAINDIICANMEIFKKNLNDGYKYIKKLLNSSNPWNIRFGLVLLLDFYVNDGYIDELFNIIDKVKSKEYYVEMANAWLISICYIKYPDKTNKYLHNNNLDDFTYNKAISKICDSYRVSKKDKEILKKLRRT